MRISSINDIIFWILTKKYCIFVSRYKSPLTMKRITLIFLLFGLISTTNAQQLYDDALSSASYALAHSKKAYNSNNVYHTQEFADKAIESFRKAEEIADRCGCIEAYETAYKGSEDMQSSLDQDTYERSRFFAKRAKDMAFKLLEELTYCQANPDDYPYPDTASLDANDEIAELSNEVSSKQQELEEKKRQLQIEQKRLEEQIAQQNLIKEELKNKRAAELKEQTLIKSKAEKALRKLETALQELSVVLNDEATFDAQSDYLRSQTDLENESLDDTKSFYVNRAKELTNSAMMQFAGHQNNIEN